MAREKAPAAPIAPSEATVLAVTVTVRPSGRARSQRPDLRHGTLRRRAGLALVLAALTLVGVTALSAGTNTLPAPPPRAAAIAAAFGYPTRCLTIAVSVVDPDYARAAINHANGCERYHGYVNASLHRVHGDWRLILDEGQLFVPNRLLAPRYRFPLGCLSLAIALHDPRLARPGSDRLVCNRARSR